MTPLPITDWQAALDDMDATLDATLTALDHYQAKWAAPVADCGTDGKPDGTRLGRLESRLREWDSRLTAAAELAAAVEQELNAREEAAGRWQEMVVGWRDGLQQRGGANTSS